MKVMFIEPYEVEVVVNTDCFIGAMDFRKLSFLAGEEVDIFSISLGKKIKHGRILRVTMNNPCKEFIHVGSLHDNRFIEFDVPSSIVEYQ